MSTSQYLGARTWVEARDLAGDATLVIPVGSTEQHGPHLPLSTDTDIAVALCRGLSDRRPEAVVAPAIPYGASGEHAGFVGTLSMGTAALATVLVELARSSDAWNGVMVVSGHGGNAAAIDEAVARSSAEGRAMRSWAPTPKVLDPHLDGRVGDAHAGLVETSMMLAIDARTVHLSRRRPGETRPLSAIMTSLRQGGVAAVSPNGVLGDPSDADKSLGCRLLAAAIDDLVSCFDSWRLAPARASAQRDR